MYEYRDLSLEELLTHSDDSKAWYWLGMAYWNKRDFVNSAKWLEKTMNDHDNLWSGKARLNLGILNLGMLPNGSKDEALRLFEGNPDGPSSNMQAAFLYYFGTETKQDTVKGLELIEKAIKAFYDRDGNDNYISDWECFQIGMMYWKEGNILIAEEYFEKTIIRHKQYDLSLKEEAEQYLERIRKSKSEIIYENLPLEELLTHSDDNNAWYWIGMAYFIKFDHVDAAAWFKKTMDDQGNSCSGEARYMLGMLNLGLLPNGSKDEALRLFEGDPDGAPSNIRSGFLYYFGTETKQDTVKGKELIEKAINSFYKISGNDDFLLKDDCFKVGKMYLQEEIFEKAEEYFEKTIYRCDDNYASDPDLKKEAKQYLDNIRKYKNKKVEILNAIEKQLIFMEKEISTGTLTISFISKRLGLKRSMDSVNNMIHGTHSYELISVKKHYDQQFDKWEKDDKLKLSILQSVFPSQQKFIERIEKCIQHINKLREFVRNYQ